MISTTAWNYTIDDSSSVLTYLPHGDGGLGNFTTLGWQPYYADVGGLDTGGNGGGRESVGPSLHITSFPGASVELAFYGTAIYLYGNANCSYSVTIDTATYSNNSVQDDLLFASQNLNPGMHFVNLTAWPLEDSDQVFGFDYAVMTNQVQGTSIPIAVVYDNTDALMEYQGVWSAGNNSQIPSTQDPQPYHKTNTTGSSVSLNFTGIAVAINGTRDWGSYTYNVTLDDEMWSYNASTMWLIGDATLFFKADLDNTNHTLTMVNTGFQGSDMWLNSITAFQINTTDAASQNDGSSSKTNVGAIVGGVIGGIAALGIAAALFWWLRRRNRTPTDSMVEPWVAATNLPTIPTVYTASNDTTDPTTVVFTGGVREKDRVIISANPNNVNARILNAVAHGPPTISDDSRSHQSSVHNRPSVTASDTLSSGAPTSSSGRPHAESYGPANVNVDQIIELIAQRIDRSAPIAPGTDHEPPPLYPQ